jgi:hypothetical protein
MAEFIVRIELHNAGSADYHYLHNKMIQIGFLSTIPSTDKKRYELPTAMFYANTNQSQEDVFTVAESVANTVSAKNRVMVIQSSAVLMKLDEAK